MMLYVFHVDVGRMLSFDMTVALSSVENLKETIQRLHGIPASNIVLLVSGGEMLTQSTQVSYYSAGTDTNPIYMFLTGDERLPPTIASGEADTELRRQVEESDKLPAVIETVKQRAQLAQLMRDLARTEEKLCERLVHEQHLQQQGWSAVVANMDDLTNEFRERFHNFCLAFDRHLQQRESYLELLRNFGDDLKQLARIPILPGLMPLAEADFHGFDELLDQDDNVFAASQAANEEAATATTTDDAATTTTEIVGTQDAVEESGAALEASTSTSTSPNKKLKMGDEGEPSRLSQTSTSSSASLARRHGLNLLQWITSKGNHSALQLMSDECVQGLDTFSAEIYEKLKQEVQGIIKLAQQGDVKEIKGLSDRLCKLEEFKYKIKKMVQDQKEQATALQQNEARALNLRDNSVLPDLCLSHRSQLQVMLENHTKIRDFCRCIGNSKDELGKNLHARLKRIVWIENGMSEFDNRLLFYHRCLRRAERHINIIEQIHRAPSTYLAAVTEVVRRKIFSDEFRLWANRLAIDFERIHSEELRRRQQFNGNFDGHFLNILFPGMADMPPAFANEHPLSFDTRLPSLGKADIELLTSQLPELATEVQQLPDMGPVIDFFVSRSGEQQRERMEQLLRQQMELEQRQPQAIAMAMATQRLSELRTEAEAEDSSTDTETEFEQLATTTTRSLDVGTSTSSSLRLGGVEQMARSTATEQLLMLSAGTLTEENAGELDQLRQSLVAMSQLAREGLSLARANLAGCRSDAAGIQDELQSELQLLRDKWQLLRMRSEQREAAEQEATLALGIKCETLEAQLEELREQLRATQLERQEAVREAREELIHEHKTEIESLRCRFKLMTSMERSPSDSSLEKVERPLSSASGNAVVVVDVEQLLGQQRLELEALRERAICEAVEAERSLWQSRLFPLNSESVMANVGILKDMLEDKERQLDLLREQNRLLTQDTYQLKTRLDLLTNEEGNSWLKEKIDYLNRDKCRLEEELSQEKSRRLEMESSVALKGSTYEVQRDFSGGGCTLLRCKSTGAAHRYIALEGCAKGDLVFVVWSMRHGQFMVVQDSLTLYFVHGDSLAALQLSPPPTAAAAAAPLEGNAGNALSVAELNQIPLPYYAIGRVVDKEYCQARKDENRYRVTRGSKFYRIKLTPLPTRTNRRERLESFSSAFSRSVSDAPPPPQPQPLALLAAPAVSVGVGARDVRDAIDAAPASVSGCSVYQSCKERTVSITSVNEEDDESASLLSERCRYISVSEEDELLAAAQTQPQHQHQLQQLQQKQLQQQQQQPQSVITEQPTASSKLKLDLLLASADIVTQSLTQQQQQQVEVESALVATPDNNTNTNTNNTTPTTTISTTTTIATTDPNANPTTLTATTTNLATISDSRSCDPRAVRVIAPTLNVDVVEPILSTAPMLPMSIGTTISEDSDEYRSLEGKDETDFPISE